MKNKKIIFVAKYSDENPIKEATKNAKDKMNKNKKKFFNNPENLKRKIFSVLTDWKTAAVFMLKLNDILINKNKYNSSQYNKRNQKPNYKNY